MIDIIFIFPPIKLGKTYAHYPLFSNLGMLQNAANIERYGFNVKIVDAFFLNEHINYREIDSGLYHLGAEISQLESYIKSINSKIFIVPITMFCDVEKLDETYFPELCFIIKKYQKHSILIAADCYICGMNYFAYDSLKLLRNIRQIDINLKGETDITLPETIKHLVKYGLNDLPYGTYRVNNNIISKEDVKYFPRDLDTLPYPAFHLINMKNYFNVINEATQLDLIHEYHNPERLFPLITSRGCVFSCSFCTQQVLKMPYRFYSLSYLKKELSYFKKKYKVDRFLFIDNNINANLVRFNKLVLFLSKIRVAWDAVNGFRADNLNKTHIKFIKKAGNKKLTVSAESADPSVLSNIIDKKLSIKSVIDVVKWSKELKIPSQVHYIIGLPGEDIEKINKTLEFAEMLYEQYNAWPLVQHAIPFRKTRLYEKCLINNYFVRDPDKTPTHYLEQFPIIKTDRFTDSDVLTIKNHFISKFKFYETTSFIIINNSCNNVCKHCEISERLNSRIITLREIKRLLYNAKAKGHNNIILTGGEPTINHKNLMYSIRLARELGIKNIALSTNGRMLVYREFVKDLISEGVNQISISINSLEPEKHDNITNVAGSYNQTIKGMQNLLQMDFKNININIRVTSLNQKGLGEIISSLKHIGISNFYIRIAVPLGRILNNLNLLPDLKLLSEDLNRILYNNHNINIKIMGMPFCMIDERYIKYLSFYPLLYLNEYRRLKTKIKKCLNCVHYISCLGFYRPEYNAYYNQDIE